ncbi:hypothetical protein NSPZN2_130077 [Nitrospira defluvii]|uniref:Uncharacterized protein n=1 Tax=Nitrospira defluvii TaxID=330214 RepID=A0ABN7LB32_9BACT|nr:hypothetical protein NSPZN2_130077 [Nitrospira defluvii]
MNSLVPRALPMIDGPRMWPPKSPLRYSLINVAQLRQAAHRLRLLLPPSSPLTPNRLNDGQRDDIGVSKS